MPHLLRSFANTYFNDIKKGLNIEKSSSSHLLSEDPLVNATPNCEVYQMYPSLFHLNFVTSNDISELIT